MIIQAESNTVISLSTSPKHISITMPSAEYTKAYKDVSTMGEKLKASGGSGPSQTDQLEVSSS